MTSKVFQFDMRVEVHGQSTVTEARDYVWGSQCDGVLVVGTPKRVPTTPKKKPARLEPDIGAIKAELTRRFSEMKDLPTPEQAASVAADYIKELPLISCIPPSKK